jgi:hypothetical protein
VPTYDILGRFRRDFAALSPEEREAFRVSVRRFIADLPAGRFRKGLRVKRVQGTDGIWEMTWAPDGRATFEYGDEHLPGQPHIVWRRIGGHDIFRRP